MVAASCGGSLKALDGETLVAHLGRMVNPRGGGVRGGTGRGGGGLGRGGEDREAVGMAGGSCGDEQRRVNELVGQMVEQAGAAGEGRQGAAAVKVPVRQLQVWCRGVWCW